MAKHNRPSHWIPAGQFRRVQAWIRRTVLKEIEIGGEVMASPFTDRIADLDDAPEGYFALSTDHRRRMVWNMVDTLCAERRIERFTPKRGVYLHLRLTNPLDRVAWALAEVDDDRAHGEEAVHA